MVRAAAAGVLDFRQADPFDNWWQRKLHWILEELDNQDYRKVLEIQHRHHITLMGNNLDDEGWDKAYSQARSTLSKILQYTFPWHKEKFSSPVQSERETALAEYRAEWGRPGEPKYDAMVANLDELFKNMSRKSTLRPTLK